jgi:hypothetical protein
MNDRELLELAAKAAGVEVWFPRMADGNGGVIEPCHTTRNGETQVWNPLTDDGDALRLAVKLGLYLNIYSASMHQSFAGIGLHIADEPHGADPYAATRRVIVRVAAEIAKQQEQPR